MCSNLGNQGCVGHNGTIKIPSALSREIFFTLRHAVSCSSHVISVNITSLVWNSINKKQNGLKHSNNNNKKNHSTSLAFHKF